MPEITFRTDIDADRTKVYEALNTHDGLTGWWTTGVNREGEALLFDFPQIPEPFRLRREPRGQGRDRMDVDRRLPSPLVRHRHHLAADRRPRRDRHAGGIPARGFRRRRLRPSAHGRNVGPAGGPAQAVRRDRHAPALLHPLIRHSDDDRRDGGAGDPPPDRPGSGVRHGLTPRCRVDTQGIREATLTREADGGGFGVGVEVTRHPLRPAPQRLDHCHASAGPVGIGTSAVTADDLGTGMLPQPAGQGRSVAAG